MTTNNTFTVETTVPASVEIESRGQTVALNVADLIEAQGPDLIARAFIHGIAQKIGDSAASALKAAFEAAGGDKEATSEERRAWGEANAQAVDEMALEMMESAVRNIIENGWTTRRAGSSTDPLDAYRAQAVRNIISSDKKSKAYKAYAKIDSKDQAARREYLMALAAKNSDAIDKIARDLKATDDAKREATSGVQLAM